MLASLIKSYYKVIILSLYVPHSVHKSWETPNLCPNNEIQSGGRRHIEFISDGLTYCRLSTIERNHHTKFHENISIHDWIIMSYWNFEI